MIDREFVNEYLKLLILQYRDMPKASGEMTAVLESFSKVYDLLNSFSNKFDLDKAVGNQLDIIGKIIGLSRNVPFAVAKKYFGFSDNENVSGFADIFDMGISSLPFRDLFIIPYDDLELNDYDYSRFIKLKIAKNAASSYMVSGSRIGVQEAVINAFDGKAYVVDNKNMTMTVYIGRQSLELINYIIALDLIPRGQGVNFGYVMIFDGQSNFGFSDNQNSKTFADLFEPDVKGGRFAELLFMEA